MAEYSSDRLRIHTNTSSINRIFGEVAYYLKIDQHFEISTELL
jgi:hypothetical protein